eukprot:scaffold127578_cov69-Phaeocystis_antarctica.AAC.2
MGLAISVSSVGEAAFEQPCASATDGREGARAPCQHEPGWQSAGDAVPSEAIMTSYGGVSTEVDMACSQGAEGLVTATAERASSAPPGGAVALA